MCHRDAAEGTSPFATVVCFALFSPAGSAVVPPGAGEGDKDGVELERSVTQLKGAGVVDSDWNTKQKTKRQKFYSFDTWPTESSSTAVC